MGSSGDRKKSKVRRASRSTQRAKLTLLRKGKKGAKAFAFDDEPEKEAESADVPIVDVDESAAAPAAPPAEDDWGSFAAAGGKKAKYVTFAQHH